MHKLGYKLYVANLVEFRDAAFITDGGWRGRKQLFRRRHMRTRFRVFDGTGLESLD